MQNPDECQVSLMEEDQVGSFHKRQILAELDALCAPDADEPTTEETIEAALADFDLYGDDVQLRLEGHNDLTVAFAETHLAPAIRQRLEERAAERRARSVKHIEIVAVMTEACDTIDEYRKTIVGRANRNAKQRGLYAGKVMRTTRMHVRPYAVPDSEVKANKRQKQNRTAAATFRANRSDEQKQLENAARAERRRVQKATAKALVQAEIDARTKF